MASLLLPFGVWAQMCAAPGNDGAGAATGVVNDYFPGAGASTLAAGSTSLTLGTQRPGAANKTLAANDLLLVIQMQDASINAVNSSAYGSGGSGGQGSTSVGSTGLYEFVRVVSVSSGVVSFSPALTNTYRNAAATATSGQKTYQIVRVPQYTSASVSGVTAPPWNGATGGVVAIDARDVLTLNGATVENQTNRAIFLAGKGFRGAVGSNGASRGSRDDWMGDYSSAGGGGGKGEGIAGTPRYLANKVTAYGSKLVNAVASGGIGSVDNTAEGYPGGSRARGAPGNAGGGGADGAPAGTNNNQYNSGGGGGGNYAAGGVGGRPWNYPLVDSGGRGGGGYVGTTAFNRIFLGGGGGAGGTNDGTADNNAYGNNGIACADTGGRCSSGASGGGIVILRAQSVTGTGVIDVRGANGYNVQNDAAGGGGAGGSVIIHSVEGGSAVIDASGGDGGNAWAGNQTNAANRHGPGGGGGGGFIAFSPSSMSVTTTINGGTPGYTTNGTTDNYGAFGNQGGIASFQSPNVPGTLPGASCAVDLRLTKSNGVNIVNAGGQTTYTLTASNVGASPTTGTVTIVDKLPQGVTIPAGSLPLTGANAANWSCSGAAGSRLITCTSATAIPAAGSSVFGVTVNIGLLSATGPTATNKAKIGGGGDPLNSTAPTEAAVDACTGNQSPAGCALDVDAVNSPLLSLTNTDNTDVVLAGGTTTYTLTVNNVGNAPTAGTVTVVNALPTGMAYTGAASFTSGVFSCSYTSSSNSVSCTTSSVIAAGASAAISLPVSIASTAPSALVNLASVGGGSDSSKPNAPTVASTQSCSPAIASEIATGCAADTDAVKRVQLSLTKDDGRFGIYVGGTTTYAFRVSNTGDTASVGTINFRDVLPGPMNWPATLTKTGANAADWTCTRLSATEVSCTSAAPIAAGGVSQFSLLANAGAMTSGTQYMNKARVGGGGDATLATAAPTADQVNACTNNSIPAGCAIDLNTAQTPPTLRLTKTHADPQSKAPGAAVAFTLTVANTGAEALANTVRVVDVFPAGLSNVTVAATQGIFSCAMGSGADSNVLTCNNTAGALAANASASIAVTATVSATTSTTLVNKAQVGTDNTDPSTSSYPTSTTVAACTALNTPTAGCATDSVPVVPSATLTVVSSVNARAASTDQFTVGISNGGPSATTAGTATSVSTAGFAVTPGTSYVLSETAAGTTNLARYTTSYACTNATAGGTAVAPGTGTTLTLTPQAGDAITCTFTNTPIAPRLTLAKSIVSRALASDQFTVAISNGGPSASTTGTSTTASTTVFTATAGTSYTLSESVLAGANLSRYTSSYSCSNAGVAGTVMPSGTGTSFSLAPQAGDNISCSFSNTAIAPRLTVNTVVAGRLLSTDQFTVGISNGGPSATTTGTQTTASAGPTTATAGTSYLLTETAAGTPATNLARYTTTYSCTNATAGGTSVGSGTGTSITVVPQAGDDISCTFTNTPVYPKLSVTKAASPGSFVAGASGQSYRITIGVANGPTTAAISIADSLPTGVTLSGVPTVSGGATLSGCSTSGSTIGACQLASGLANGSYVVTIPVSVAPSATSTGAANTANLGGGGDPSCTAAATTEACDPTTGAVAVKTPANVGLVKSGAATAVAGNSYVYTLALSNSGQTATASNLVVRDQLAPGMVATAVSGANCGTLPSAAGALLSCTVADPVAADGGTASIQLTVTMPSGGGNVVNYAATHPSGSGNPGVDPGPACTNAANVVCASATTASSTPANVSLSKTGAATALTGSSYVYTLTLSNSGQLATGSNPIIKDQLPAGVVATSVSGASCGTLPSSAAALLTCTVAGPVAAGASATVQLTVTLPNAGGTLVNNAATNPTGSGAPGVDPGATCVNSATTFCASHSLAVNTPASLATTNVLTSVNGSPVPAGYLAKPGDVLTYTVTVVNSGGTAGSTDVGQTVPAGTTYTGSGQGWSAGCTDAGTQCTQTVPVGANQTSTVQYTVTVASPGSTATIVDTATSSVGTCTACQVSTDTQRADMQASISVSPGTTSATGVELTYTSICKNNGPQTALNAECTVSAPAGAATTCTPASPAATLASGSSITCTTKLTPSVVGDYAVSVATSNTLFDPATGNNSATATVKVNTPAALRIVKSLAQVNGAAVPANYAAKIGDTLTYAMVVTNTGGTAGTTVLTETVPEGTQFVGGNAPDLSQGWSQAPQACDAAASICTQTVSVPAQSTDGVPGQQTVQFTVKVLAPATSNGKITNTVASDVAAACASGTCAVETANAVADMQAQISSIPATAVVVGQSVTITGTCTNNGPADAVNASCAMAVNNAGTSIAGTCAANADLAMGANLSCSATFVAAEGAISATIHATTQSYESNTANNTDTKSTVGNTPASLATTNVLTAVNGSPVPAGYLAKPGDVLTYTVSVTNSGGTAGSTEVGQTVPAGTTYTGTGQGWGAGCTAAGTQCAQPVSVGAGQTSTVSYTVTVSSPGSTPTIVNTATSSVGSCTTCVVTTNTQQADMAAAVTVTPGAISTTGVELTYTAVCKNNGPQAALNASCVVSAPAGASAAICTPTSPAATLASGDSITCVTKLTPSSAGDYAVSVATGNDLYDAAPANNTANSSVKVNTPAALSIVKSLVQVNGADATAGYAAKIGDKLTYAMVVTNTGGTAGTTVLTETVPEGTQFVGVSSDPTQGWSEAPQKCEAAGTTCVQSVNVPAQSADGVASERTVQFTVEVVAPATTNGKITNTVASDMATACAGTNCSVETSNAVADMQAQINSMPAGAVVVGESVTITGVCTNNGPASAASASCAMVVSNGGASITATCDAAKTLAVNETLSCSATFVAAQGDISASVSAATQSYESDKTNNTDSKSTVGNTPASLATTNVLTAVNGSPVPAGYLAKPGDVLTYTVSVTNSGGTAGSTEVGQTVPAGTTYTGTGQGWGAGCAAAGTQCAQLVTVAAGQTSMLQYTVTVASPGSIATIVDTVTSSVGTCTACQVTTGTQQADMQATVTVTPGTTSTTGVELVYTAVCKNNGPQSAINAACVVIAPANAVTTCAPTTPAATLASGSSITCTTKLTPSAADDYAVSVTASNALYDAAPGNNTANATVKVNTPADLHITKTLAQVNGAAVPANYAAKIGDKLTYAMVVTNTGGTAGTTVLTETVPEGTQFVGVSSDPTQGWSEAPEACLAAASTCMQSVTVPAQSAEGAAGEKTVEFTVEVIAPATSNGKITNTVLSDVAAACAGTNCAVETANAVADMQAQITDIPATAVVVGQSVTITGVCTNKGPADAVNASCEMTVNNGGNSIPASCGANVNLALNESISCTASFTAVEGAISASIRTATQSYESNTANNTDTKSTVGNTAASLVTTNVLTAVNGNPVPAGYLAKPGDVLTYTVTVANTGGTAGSTDVGQTVPAGTSYTGTGEGWSAGCAAASSTCNQTVAVGAGQTSSVTYTVTVAGPGSTATIVNTATSSVGSCSACQVTTGTQHADMQATVAVTPGPTSTTGVELVYTSVCKNQGPQSALNASCIVTAPANAVTTCAPVSPVATLESGESITCTTKFTPSDAGDYAVSVATSNTLYDPAAGNNTATKTVKVNTPAELNIAKTLAQVNGAAVPDNYAAKIGDTLTYHLRVTNAGGTASTLELTETVPEGTRFVGGAAANPDQGWSLAPHACDAAASTCMQSVTVPAQSAGVPGEQTVQFTVEVLAPANSSGKIINTVTSDVPAACAAGGCTAETANAVADMQAQITTIPSGAVVVGDSVTITGQCTNNGPVEALNASCVMTVNNGGNSIAATCGANTQLAVGESISCTATFTAAEGSISASMTAATDSYESDTANNTATQAVNGNTPSAVTVRNVLVKVNDAPVPAGYVIKPGDKLTYQVLVSNTGGTPGSTVLTETVPVGTRYAGTDEGWTAGCGASRSTCNRSVTVPGGSAQAPGTVAFEYTVRVEDTVSSPNVVNIVDSSAPGSCSAACSVSTPTQAADMQVSTPATIDAKVGVEFTLTSVCRNAGPATASNARCDVSGAPAGAVTVCTPTPPIASLAVGESVTCTTRFTPSSTAAITITTRASSDVYDPVAANSEASASAVFTSTPPAAVKAVPVNAAWAMGLVALLLMLLAGRALPHRQGRGRQN
ncbi:prealbumin-like fold domain-containing protein [Comamonas sediminis]|uniref:prealbumin-like fold domain-containing protein n=1 Tax=Comamonas sediminis TaxID=1783360 RepID=UPI003D29CB73